MKRGKTNVAALPKSTISICSGIGGLDLGFQLATGARTVCYIEREGFAASTLVARMEEKSLDEAPIWDDLTTFDGTAWRGKVDSIIAGFPCQPVSHAGKRKGRADDRWLWDDVARIIREVGPRIVFLENVAGILSMGAGVVLGGLSEMGYDANWCLLPAGAVGAPMRRLRWFCLAHANNDRREGERIHLRSRRQDKAETIVSRKGSSMAHFDRSSGRQKHPNDSRSEQRVEKKGLSERSDHCSSDNLADSGGENFQRRREPRDMARQVETSREQGRRRDKGGNSLDGGISGMAHTNIEGLEGRELRQRERAHEWTARKGQRSLALFPPRPNDREGWRRFLERNPNAEPAVRRGADGTANRVDRLRSLGNAVCPLQSGVAFSLLWKRAHR